MTTAERPPPRRGGVPDKQGGFRVPTIVQSFNFAFEGIIYVLRTQRNMRIHFALAALVLILGLAVGVSKLELLALIVGISFVLIAEMLNTALEAAIDIATTSFDPLAKIAKDVTAGMVLIAAIAAVLVGLLVLGPPLWARFAG